MKGPMRKNEGYEYKLAKVYRKGILKAAGADRKEILHSYTILIK